MNRFLGIILLCPLLSIAQNTLTVKAEGLKSSDGLVAVGVYNTNDSFLKEGETYTGTFEEAEKGTTTIQISDLPSGTYAISIFHDRNGNKKLDTNFMGIPKEPVAFSNATMKTFGPPGFKECSFNVVSDVEISIPFK